MPYDWQSPQPGLSQEDVAGHLQLTPDELNSDLLISITKSAIAHTETLCGPLVDPVPDELIAAVKLMCGHLYEQRENSTYGTGTFASVPLGYDDLTLNHRLWAF